MLSDMIVLSVHLCFGTHNATKKLGRAPEDSLPERQRLVVWDIMGHLHFLGTMIPTNVGIAMSFAPSPIHHHFYGWYRPIPITKQWVVYYCYTHIPLQSDKSPSNPMKSPFSYGFPMVFLWFFWLMVTSPFPASVLLARSSRFQLHPAGAGRHTEMDAGGGGGWCFSPVEGFFPAQNLWCLGILRSQVSLPLVN